MKGIVVTTDNVVSVRDFPSPLYESLGEVIDGYIEFVNPRGLPVPFCMIVNEEGRLKGLPINSIGSFFYQTYIHGDPIVGNIVIMKQGMTSDGPDIIGLVDREIGFIANLIQKFTCGLLSPAISKPPFFSDELERYLIEFKKHEN